MAQHPIAMTKTRDQQTTNADGTPIERLPAGVRIRDATTLVDDRGSLCEIYDPRWGWHDAPLTSVYTFTLRPGKVKGWAMHEHHEDRYFVLAGELELVLYDGREDSPTHGLVSKIYLTPHRRGLVCIPTGVWHANRNIGQTDVVAINMPTRLYDHENPDKIRLPPDTDEIPHRFDDGLGY